MASMDKVQDSSDCCIKSKFSCAQKGYFQDDDLSLFVKKLRPRSAIINRGYYIRFKAMDEVFRPFAHLDGFQIISLGAGYDSSYFRLKRNNLLPPKSHYVEVDFPEVMKKKLDLVQDVLCLDKNIPSTVEQPQIVLRTNGYSMLGLDLTDVLTFEKSLLSVGIKLDTPTLFLSECSITYIDSEQSQSLIRWVQSHFQNSAFVAYEQVYPDDAFGLIMRNHFVQVGCPLKSIVKYPDEDSQCKRFKEMNWSECHAITMYTLFASLSSKEKVRIKLLEMFDEYEMWHEKCHHYVLVWAAQGQLEGYLPPSLNIQSPPTHIIPKKVLNLKRIPANACVQRFGHQVLPVSACTVLLSGGFGMAKGKHQRLGDLLLYNTHLQECKDIANEAQLDIGKRMFHTVTKLSSSDTLVIMGGRSSPKEIFEEVLIVQNLETFSNGKCTSLEVNRVPMQMAVWRHSASPVCVQGTEYIVVFGGLSQECNPSDKCFLLNTKTWKWSSVDGQQHSPCPRHSHSAATYKESSVIVSGGLTDDETILQSIHLLNCEHRQWTTLPVVGLLPRYSHSSHVWQDHLVLVGGITSIGSHKLGAGVVNLNTLQAFEVALPGQDPECPLLLSNHSSYVQGEEVVIVGGGGNCFSFGTHFNKLMVSFRMPELLS